MQYLCEYSGNISPWRLRSHLPSPSFSEGSHRCEHTNIESGETPMRVRTSSTEVSGGLKFLYIIMWGIVEFAGSHFWALFLISDCLGSKDLDAKPETLMWETISVRPRGISPQQTSFPCERECWCTLSDHRRTLVRRNRDNCGGENCLTICCRINKVAISSVLQVLINTDE